MSETKQYDVIVVGAGVVGPPLATAFARQGRKVLIIERDWSEPDRIVGELMQPAGLKALRELGLVQAVNNIEAIYVSGYYVSYHDHNLKLKYPHKSEIANDTTVVTGCVSGGNDKLITDSTLDAQEFENDGNHRGVAFHHGKFLNNLRDIVRSEPNVDWVEGTAIEMVRNEIAVCGVKVRLNDKTTKTFKGHLTVACDGIYSKFRRELSTKNVPFVGSHFVGLTLKDAKLPAPHYGHVILGEHAPVLIYQISPHDTRILCAYRSTKPPSSQNNELKDYLEKTVLPNLPAETQPSFKDALINDRYRVMPNQYLAAKKNEVPGLLVVGDALNMRHPLTGGGMTVGLNDAALIAKMLSPENVPDFSSHEDILQALSSFHWQRKNLDSVINTLSIALYSLFAADSSSLTILQKGCFKYFQRGGECVTGPVSLLSGLAPKPVLLFNHFFSVAFYSIYCNFYDRGVAGFLIGLYEAFATIITAIIIFTPYLWNELMT